jgi:hypothetical protein
MDKPYGYVRADGKGLFIYGDHQFTNNQNHDLIPVYTHPKDWVGLTAKEIMAIGKPFEEKDRSIQDWGLFACAIEAKLKEKNSA